MTELVKSAVVLMNRQPESNSPSYVADDPNAAEIDICIFSNTYALRNKNSIL